VDLGGVKRTPLDGAVGDGLEERGLKLGEGRLRTAFRAARIRRSTVMLYESKDVHAGGQVEKVGLKPAKDMPDLGEGNLGIGFINFADRVAVLPLPVAEKDTPSAVS
jgi:hypothetical protein